MAVVGQVPPVSVTAVEPLVAVSVPTMYLGQAVLYVEVTVSLETMGWVRGSDAASPEPQDCGDPAEGPIELGPFLEVGGDYLDVASAIFGHLG